MATSSTDLVLYHGDCVEGMATKLAPKGVDVVVTSPPYNIGIKYGTHRDDMPRDKYLMWMHDVAGAVQRVLKPGGSFFLNVGNKPSDHWIAWDVLSTMRDIFQLQNVFHWVKAISLEVDADPVTPSDGVLSVGHYKPINSPRFVNDVHEYVFHLTHTGEVAIDRLALGVPFVDKTNVKRWSGKKDRRCRGNTWYIPYETIQYSEKDRPHPATFPVKLPEMCLRLHGVDRTSVVLDPFAGLGTTMLAAKRLGVERVIGFDIDGKYLSFARKRFEEG